MIKRYIRLNVADGVEMDSYSGAERRRSQRVIYPFEVWYKDRNKNNQGFKHAYGKDISEHGLLFETYENFPSCTILEIKLESPISGGESFTPLEVSRPRTAVAVPLKREGELLTGFTILAEVVRTEETRRQWLYNIGVSFCKVDPDCLRFLKEYVSKGLHNIEDRREIIGVT